MSRMSGYTATKIWDPIAIIDGNADSEEITVPGARMGDFALASLDQDVQDLQLTADVTAADTVTVVLSNSTGGSVNLPTTTRLRVKVIPADVI